MQQFYQLQLRPAKWSQSNKQLDHANLIACVDFPIHNLSKSLSLPSNIFSTRPMQTRPSVILFLGFYPHLISVIGRKIQQFLGLYKR